MKFWDVLACGLFGAAFIAEFCGKWLFSQAAQAIARAAGGDEAALTAARQTADSAVDQGAVLEFVGLGLATVGLVCWLISVFKGRRLSPVWPLVLFGTYVAWLFALV